MLKMDFKKRTLKRKEQTDRFMVSNSHLHVYDVKPENAFCGFSSSDNFFCNSDNLVITVSAKSQRHLEFSKLLLLSIRRRIEAKN